jgi:hypothetical protein
MTLRLSWVLPALPVTASVLLLFAAAVSGEDRAKQDGPFPQQDFAPLPGKVVGVLAGNGQAVLAQEGRKLPADTLCLGSGEGSYRFLYVPVPKKPLIGALNVRVGPKGEKTQRFDSLSLANLKTVEQWGVTRPHTLVEVEVNGGKGAPPGENFVATGLRVLEGSREYPLKTADVMERLQTGYQASLKQKESAISQMLTEARKELLPSRKPTGGRERTELLFVTWLPDQQLLRVVIQTRTAETAPGPNLPPKVSSEPEPTRRPATISGVEWGMSFDVSRLGKTEQSRELPLRKFQKEVLLTVPPATEKAETPAAKPQGR